MPRQAHSAGVWFMHAALWMFCACVSAFSSPAWAQSRAWLDRERIAYDETVILNIQVDTTQASGVPDVRALQRDFEIVGQDMRQNLNLSSGDVALRVEMQLVLRPLRSGEIEIPMLSIGSAVTPSLRLTVLPSRETPPSQAPPPAVAGTRLFIQTRVDNETPYVQQTLGYTVRLYYISDSLIDGRIDQDQPDGASLQKIGDDLRLSQRVGENDYNVIERRFLLIPERSGAVTVPPARFQGRSVGLFDDMFDPRREETRIRSGQIALQVKPIPAVAPQPWLPLRGLTLRYLEAPQSLRAGESATIAVEAVANGATAAQLPGLEMTTGNSAQVFAEPAQTRDDFVAGRPQARVLRQFSVLPAREGTLRIAGPRVSWWDTEAGVVRIASLPDLVLPVAAGTAGAATSAKASADADDDTAERRSPRTLWYWVASPLLALLWVGALALGWRIWSARKRPVSEVATQAPGDHRRSPPMPMPSSGSPGAESPLPAVPPMDARAVAAALARGDLGEIAGALCAAASVKAGDLDALRVRLGDPVQQAAVDALQRARWGDGDTAVTLQQLRRAFASGPRWRAIDTAPTPTLLPSLYPER
jgi:hypothetical protein